MPLKIVCPHCKKPLSVPRKLLGSHASCPHCSGRIQVPQHASNGASDAETPPRTATPPNKTSRSQQSSKATAQVDDASAAHLSERQVWGQPVDRPPIPSLQGSQTARFISAEAAQSPLTVAEDGQLPDLRLIDSNAKQTEEDDTQSVNPLVVTCAISLSIVLSISLAMMDFTPDGGPNDSRAEVRQCIEKEFFTPPDSDKPFPPFEHLLREAQRAHTKGDRAQERKLYHRVIFMLRQERGENEKGLAGSHDRDERLKTLISALLRGG